MITFRPAVREGIKSNKAILSCAHCHKAYSIKASHASKSRFCSLPCKAEHYRTRPKNSPRPCVVCGTIFTPSRAKGHARFCSKRCIAKTADITNLILASKRTAKARGDAQRGIGQGKAYRKLMGRHEHRVVAEKMIGRPLLFRDVVHHKDGNILNNDPSNLEIMDRAQHMREHGIGIPGMKLWWKPWETRRSK